MVIFLLFILHDLVQATLKKSNNKSKTREVIAKVVGVSCKGLLHGFFPHM